MGSSDVSDGAMTDDATHTHTQTLCEPALLFPSSPLSHYRVSHLSSPITVDTTVKLSNKSVSQGSTAPPADWLTGWLTDWLHVSHPARGAIRAQMPKA